MAAHASTEQPPPPTKAASVGGSVARRTALASYVRHPEQADGRGIDCAGIWVAEDCRLRR